MRKALHFEAEEEDEQQTEEEVVVSAVRRCCQRDSPLELWGLAGRPEAGVVGQRVLKRFQLPIGALPLWWRRLFWGPSHWAAAAEQQWDQQGSTPADDDMNFSAPPRDLQFITPTKKILMTANSGSEAARRNGTRTANNRERLRDAMCDLFSAGLDNVKLKCNFLLQNLDRENSAWFCQNLLDVYVRFCNKLVEHEQSMIEKTASPQTLEEKDAVAGEKRLVLQVCESLFRENMELHQVMQRTIVDKIESLMRETHELFLVGIELFHVARLLALVTFVGIGDDSVLLEHFNVSHSLFLRLSANTERILDDARLSVLHLIVLDSFFEHVPDQLPNLEFARSALLFCWKQRQRAIDLRNLTELFIVLKCNNVLSCFSSAEIRALSASADTVLEAEDSEHSVAGHGADELGQLDAQLSHPLFLVTVFMSRTRIDGGGSVGARKVVSAPVAVAGNQETKYWFFKLHTDMLPIVNLVAKSVSRNAVLFSLQESDSIFSSQEEDGNLAADFEEKYFEICFVKCQNYVNTHCKGLIQQLAAMSTDSAVVQRATHYCIDGALQMCYDSLGETVKEHLRHRLQVQKKNSQPRNSPASKTAPSVLHSPFVHKDAASSLVRLTRRDFAVRLHVLESVCGDMDEQNLAQFCDDETEFMLFLLSALPKDQLQKVTFPEPDHTAMWNLAKRHVQQA